ncbi:hypothetical protein FOQG_17922 [Fusarium oxysporum f. sp. raphani 54005]|uniref:Uncharacterized protein n=1 Tax=Fusarium oxysporum f. sp. raphani 54005 TaxID=1089458 RepID=X0BEU4_FUSOX|nr:hypothetical protein FOQG_17922 [Fusarium oxysporum f. sp. raphani 54005]
MEKCGDNSRVLVRDVAADLGRASGDYDTGYDTSSAALKANESSPGFEPLYHIQYFRRHRNAQAHFPSP